MHYEHCGICIFSNWCFHVSSIYTAVELVDHMAGPGALLGGTMVKNPPANVEDGRDVGLIPGSGRSPGEGNGNPLQYFCLENSMDRGAWLVSIHRITENRTWLSRLSSWVCMHTHTHGSSSFVFVFLRNFCTVLYSGRIKLLSYQQYASVPFALLFLVFLIKTTLIGMSWYFIVILMYISLMISNIEHFFFMCLLVTFIYTLEKCLFWCSAHFLIRLFTFMILSCRSCLYILVFYVFIYSVIYYQS